MVKIEQSVSNFGLKASVRARQPSQRAEALLATPERADIAPMQVGKDELKQPFSTVLRVYRRGHFVPTHSHTWPQLLYASSGVMAVETPYGSWVLPANRALWLPAMCRHETRMLTEVCFNSLYLDPSDDWKKLECKAIEITPLLRELVLAAKTIEMQQEPRCRDQLITRLIIEELRISKGATSPIPMPQEARLVRLCRLVIENPSLQTTFAHLASDSGGSTKTFSRLFVKELGMTFRDWRELVQIAHASAYLAQGDSIKTTASQLGYTASAFSVMVRRLTGATPQVLKDGLSHPEAMQAN